MTNMLRLIFLSFFAFISFAVAAEPAKKTAEKPLVQSVLFAQPKLNREIKLPRAKFDAATILITESPLNDKGLSYTIRLPKNWKKLQSVSTTDGFNIAGARDVLGTIAEYISPNDIDQNNRFRIRAGTLPFAISAKDWLLNFVVSNNYTLQGLDEVSNNRVAAQYVFVEAGAQYAARIVAQISGSKIILAEMIVPISSWNAFRDHAVWSMVTFKLVTPQQANIETMQNFSFADIGQFSYPNSWLLYAEPVITLDRMTATLVNIKGGSERRKIEDADELAALALDARVDITAVKKADKTTLASEMKTMKTHLLGLGFVIGMYAGDIKIDKLDKRILQARTDVYNITAPRIRSIDYELWVSVIETNNRYYIVQTISIARNNDFYAWARNREMLKLVLQSLKPLK